MAVAVEMFSPALCVSKRLVGTTMFQRPSDSFRQTHGVDHIIIDRDEQLILREDPSCSSTNISIYPECCHHPHSAHNAAGHVSLLCMRVLVFLCNEKATICNFLSILFRILIICWHTVPRVLAERKLFYRNYFSLLVA